ncbi:MAG TPA: chromosome partitioning protein ParB [Sulfurospirillum sp. UBA11407]|jgi:ParB family chromosome partitioning protein|nr:MAG TPA: chromosome partitioning protein ParB [Sulfurospirillum sp. UBA11407]DAB34645.1 MAG TPA: chromosome partitioning protein ParB [Sulfurospirillum sp. UBA12182]
MSSSSKKALGRGLGAIFEDVEDAYNREFISSSSPDLVREIDVNRISPNPYQPRKYFNEAAIKELSESIKKHGLLQPIIVVEKDDNYMLLAGERRFRATKEAGFGTIRAIVADIESENLRELALIENIQREDLNPIELAIAYKELIEEYNITQEGLSEIIKKSRTQITNTLRLLSLTKKTQDLIIASKISQGHAKVVVGLEPKDEETIINTILGQKLSVRETENLVKKLKAGEQISDTPKKELIKSSFDFQELEKTLHSFGLKTKIKDRSITIEFKNNALIEEFLEKIKK